MNLLQKLIPPDLAFKMLKKKIEKTLEKDIKEYQLYLDNLNNDEPVYFKIDGIKYGYPQSDGLQLKSAIELAVQQQLKKDNIIDKIIIHYTDESLTAKVGFTNEKNLKEIITIKL